MCCNDRDNNHCDAAAWKSAQRVFVNHHGSTPVDARQNLGARFRNRNHFLIRQVQGACDEKGL